MYPLRGKDSMCGLFENYEKVDVVQMNEPHLCNTNDGFLIIFPCRVLCRKLVEKDLEIKKMAFGISGFCQIHVTNLKSIY